MIRPIRHRDPALGLVRWCAACAEWWPEDREFWGVTACRDGYRRSWCRACKTSRAGAARRAA